MAGTQIPKELVEETYKAIETAKSTGKIAKGTNEVTKAIERGTASLVAIAKDVTPPEIVLHLPVLSKEKGILCVEVPSKTELGASAGLGVGAACVAITREGESKKIVQRIAAQLGFETKPTKPVKEEEPKKEQKKRKKDEE